MVWIIEFYCAKLFDELMTLKALRNDTVLIEHGTYIALVSVGYDDDGYHDELWFILTIMMHSS